MELPKSDSDRLIIPANNEGLGFRLNCFHQEYAGQFITREEFTSIVKEANKVCEDGWRRRRLEEEATHNVSLKYSLYFAILLCIISYLLLLILFYGDGEGSLLSASSTLISIAGLIILAIVVICHFQQPSFIELERLIGDNLATFFELQNEKCKQRGFRWVLGDDFFWIELKLGQN
jgi:hypothetical protein